MGVRYVKTYNPCKRRHLTKTLFILGGSTGDDSYDHTITDKVQAYNPRLQQWSVEEPLSNPKHKACAVAIDNFLVITGGTMLGEY